MLPVSNAVCIIHLVECFEEAGLATGFFVPAIWELYESPAKLDDYWRKARQ